MGTLYTETVNGTLPPALAAYGFHPMPITTCRVFAQVNDVLNNTPPFTRGENGFGPANSYGGYEPVRGPNRRAALPPERGELLSVMGDPL